MSWSSQVQFVLINISQKLGKSVFPERVEKSWPAFCMYIFTAHKITLARPFLYPLFVFCASIHEDKWIQKHQTNSFFFLFHRRDSLNTALTDKMMYYNILYPKRGWRKPLMCALIIFLSSSITTKDYLKCYASECILSII